jgi:hypothetical protein
MKKRLMAVTLLLLASLLPFNGLLVEDLGDVFVDREDLYVLKGDILAVYFKPTLPNLEVRCVPVSGQALFDVRFISNYTDAMFGVVTTVLIRPESEATYNISISFVSDDSWNYLIGAYTTNFSFYYENYGKAVETYGYFVRLRPPYTRPAGNFTINILLTVQGATPSSGFFIRLPAPANLALIVAFSSILAYINGFIFLDTYFKHKREIVSSRRWILACAALLISVLIVYWFFVTLASTPQRGA